MDSGLLWVGFEHLGERRIAQRLIFGVSEYPLIGRVFACP